MTKLDFKSEIKEIKKIKNLFKVVAASPHFDLMPKEIFETSNSKSVVAARRAAVLLARASNYKNPQIAKCLPGSSGKVIANIYNRAKLEFSEDDEFYQGVMDVAVQLKIKLPENS